MYITVVELLFIVLFVSSFFIAICITWKCRKNIDKYKVKIYPDALQESVDDFSN